MKNINIRKFNPKDLLMVLNLEIEGFGTGGYPRSFFRQAYDIFGDLFLVAENEKNELVGYIIGALHLDKTEGWILSMAIKKNLRRKGYGMMLTENIIQILIEKGVKNILLTVRPSNEPAINLYKKLNFLELKIIDDYYGPDEPRIIMEKILE